MFRFKRIVILTGAGISAESGISTFRDKDGLWSKVDYREVAPVWLLNRPSTSSGLRWSVPPAMTATRVVSLSNHGVEGYRRSTATASTCAANRNWSIGATLSRR
jgi:hypothetical protein